MVAHYSVLYQIYCDYHIFRIIAANFHQSTIVTNEVIIGVIFGLRVRNKR